MIYDLRGGTPHILMGQRPATQVFMPGRFVFPGGRVDPDDENVAAIATPPRQHEITALMLQMSGKTSALRAKSLAVAGVRETFEETGIIFGSPHASQATGTPTSGVRNAEPKAGPVWDQFNQRGLTPDARPFRFFARAITPPGQNRRYDTRFFLASRSAISAETQIVDGELERLNWYSMPEIANLNIAPITRRILDDFETSLREEPELLKQPELRDARNPQASSGVPLYHFSDGTFRRDLLIP